MESKDWLIYANELIEEIDDIIGNINFSSPYQNNNHLIVEGLERARDCVLDACAVDAVEVVHGRWMNNPGVFGYECNQCGKWLVFERGNAEMNYCPNCGAYMKGDQNENL